MLAGERGPGGFKLETPPAQPVPIYIAALRDQMLRLGGELGDGTFVNFLPLSAVEHVVARVREGEAAAGRGTTSSAASSASRGDGLAVARFMFAAYATVPVYEAFFRGLGWGEAIDPMVEAWRGGDRKRALELVARGAAARDLHLRRRRRRCASGSALFAARGDHDARADAAVAPSGCRT